MNYVGQTPQDSLQKISSLSNFTEMREPTVHCREVTDTLSLVTTLAEASSPVAHHNDVCLTERGENAFPQAIQKEEKMHFPKQYKKRRKRISPSNTKEEKTHFPKQYKNRRKHISPSNTEKCGESTFPQAILRKHISQATQKEEKTFDDFPVTVLLHVVKLQE